MNAAMRPPSALRVAGLINDPNHLMEIIDV
jgi:hypothetical protein